MDLIEMTEFLKKKQEQETDICKLQQYIQSLPADKRNEPVYFSCNCKRCLPSM